MPTDLGYRFYVDRLLGSLTPRPAELALDLSSVRNEIDEALQATIDALAQVTHLLALATAPQLQTTTVRHVEVLLRRVSKREVVHVGDEIVTAGSRAGSLASLYPKGIPIGRVSFVGGLSTDLWQQVLVESDVDFSSLDSVLGARAAAPDPGAAVSFAESAVVGAIVFVAALLQVTLFASLDVAGGVADVLLLSLLSIALLRGAVVGTVAGFLAGLLVDVLTLDTLGVSALLLLTGRLLGRALRRDDRSRPGLRAALDRAGGHDRDRLRRLRAPLPAG